MEDPNVVETNKLNIPSQFVDQVPDDITAYKEPLGVDDCLLTDNSYYCESGFKDGTYLVPHGREIFYNGRRQISTYSNIVRPILDAMVNPVFADIIARNFKSKNNTDSFFSDFISNVDNANTTLQEFMDEVTRILVRHGQCFIVMDNFPVETQPKTKFEAKKERIFPYILLKTKLDVADKGQAYTLDRWGNLSSIIFLDVKVIIDKKEVQLYRKWTTDESVLVKKEGENYINYAAPVAHGLGRIPIIVAYKTKRHDKQKLYVNPPAYDLVKKSLTIFNLESELRDLERAQAFSILVVQSNDRNHIGLGAHNILFVGKDTTIAPLFISPDVAIMQTLAESIKRHIDDLYRLAEQSGVTAVRTATSGIEQSFKFFGHESVLRQISMLVKNIEKSIANLFQDYTGEDLSDYDADYPTDFSPSNVDGEVETISKYLKLSPPAKAEALAMEKVTRIVLADQDDKRLQEAIEEIKDKNKQEKQYDLSKIVGQIFPQGTTGIQGLTGME